MCPLLYTNTKVRKRHIAYNKRNYGINNVFEEYFTTDMYNFFMEKIVLASLLGCGDYYNSYHANKIIKNSNLKEKEKKELLIFLNETSVMRSISKSKEGYSKYKYDKFIKQLNALEIHPILIPKGEVVSCIRNPLRDIRL